MISLCTWCKDWPPLRETLPVNLQRMDGHCVEWCITDLESSDDTYQWLLDQGLLARTRYGDLRDLISRRAEDGSVVSVAPSDTLLVAFQRMRAAEVSQLPVLEAGALVGVLDETDVLLKLGGGAAAFRDPVHGAMSASPETLRPDAGLPALQRVLDRGLVAMVADEAGFHGLITRFDLLNHLRRAL
jgi:cystathionine beta-synthase